MALIYCTECGKQYSDKAMACPNCGNPTITKSTSTQSTSNNQQANASIVQNTSLIEKLAAKERTSGIIWMVVAIVQAIAGLSGLWFPLIAALINALSSAASFKKARRVMSPYGGMVAEYDQQKSAIIFGIIFNAIFGGIVGVAGNVFDLITRNFVLDNKAYFEDAAEKNEAKIEAEASAMGKVRLTVNLTSQRGAPTAIIYTVDGMPEKYTVSTVVPIKHYLMPGSHTILCKYKAKQFNVNLTENQDLNLYCSKKDLTLAE